MTDRQDIGVVVAQFLDRMDAATAAAWFARMAFGYSVIDITARPGRETRVEVDGRIVGNRADRIIMDDPWAIPDDVLREIRTVERRKMPDPAEGLPRNRAERRKAAARARK